MMILIGLWPTAPPIACVDMLGIPFCRNVRDFIRLAVDADVGGDDFARFPVHNVHDPTEIARFAEVLPVIVGEFVFLTHPASAPCG